MKYASFVLLFAFAGIVAATMSIEELASAKKLIDSNAGCGNLSDGQLEQIGEYYMEQMHPGQVHEYMDRMMGGEGSESLKQQHIQMALVLYCGRTDTNVTYGGMMAMMPMFYRGGGWMGGSGGWGPGAGGGMMGYGMMGYNYDMMGGYGWVLGLVFWVLVLLALILIVVWLYKNVTGARTLSGQETLKLRYAKGEISKKEYEEMKKVLE